MNNKAFYEQLREAVVKHLEAEDTSFAEFADEITSKYGKPEEVTLSVDGKDVALNRDTIEGSGYEIARLDDPIQFSWLRFKGDEFILFDSGYYDSWNGGDWENDIRVGTIQQHTIDFPAEVR